MNKTAKMLRELIPWAEPIDHETFRYYLNRSAQLAKLHFAANQAVLAFDGKHTKLTPIQRTMMERLEEAVKEG